MPSGIPHSAVVGTHITSYLQEAEKLTSKLATIVEKDPDYIGSFRNSIATYSVLAKLARGNRVSLLSTAASTVRRAPFLIAFGQLSTAYTDLRRFLESVSRYPYFYEHPVEWRRVLTDPEAGTSKDDSDPIGWCAAREQKWYVNYVKARFPDQSGLVSAALETYARAYKVLSSHVHVTKEAAANLKIADVVQKPAAGALKGFRETQKEIYTAGLITSLAVKPSRLNSLTAIERSWLDWLLGPTKSKALVSGDFLA